MFYNLYYIIYIIKIQYEGNSYKNILLNLIMEIYDTNTNTYPIELINPKECENDNNQNKDIISPIIKHIVLSGGGTVFFGEYAILKESNISGFWDFKNIESIYGTSAGAMLGAMLCLLSIPEEPNETTTVSLNWDILDTYLIHRPWQNLFKIDILTIIQSINKDGILDINILKDAYNPVFKSKDIPIDITLKDFFELTKKDFHTFSVEIDSFEVVDISHTTHPDWTVIEAVYASSCLPILFSCFNKHNKIYTDGGIMANYPLIHLLKNNPTINTEEILAIKLNYNNIKEISIDPDKSIDTPVDPPIDDINTYNLNKVAPPPRYIYDTTFTIIMKMFEFIEKNHNINANKIKNEINMYISYKNMLYDIYLASNFPEERKKLMGCGKDIWNSFILYNK